MNFPNVGDPVTVVVDIAAGPSRVRAHTIVDRTVVTYLYPAGSTFRVNHIEGRGQLVVALCDEDITWIRGWVDLCGPEANALRAAYALRSENGA